jgi:uncharacterized protein (TIGR00730 family)
MPGGFGTLDELFEVLTLVQTRKIEGFPVILMGTSYWRGLLKWIKTTLVPRKVVNAEDLRLVTVTDDPEEALDLIEDYVQTRGFEAMRDRAFT